VDTVADMLAEREREEGIPHGELEIFPLIGTARGVWNVREVLRARRCASTRAMRRSWMCRRPA
jgi:citrate lyase beta subunit